MLHKTKGVVLNTINYSDKYILVQIFTEMFGQVTYMVSKTKSKNTKVPRSIFFPFAIVEMETQHQASRDIQRIKEVRNALPLFYIPTQIGKKSMDFFFLYHSIQILEMTDKSIANYHLVFMIKLSRFLGFYPNLEDYGKNYLFDMLNGEFVPYQPMHRYFLDRYESEALSRLARITYENMHHFIFNRQDRINILNRMLEYYRLHLYDFPQIKSLEVLHELF